jgi:hypothetical protein
LRVVADADLAATMPKPCADGAAQGLVAFVGAKAIDDVQIILALKA